MSVGRFSAVARLDLGASWRRPMLWTLVAVVALLAWGLSTGHVAVSSGSVTVGGHKAWITSEFSNAFLLSMLIASFYSFFASIAAGLAISGDDELKIGELLHATRLNPGEYVWGKAAALFAAFFGILGLHLILMVFFNHVLPNPEATEIRGPFAVLAYLRPAVVFGVPVLTFFLGVAFYLGERLRRPAVVFLFPVAMTVLAFFLWNWTPTWLSPGIDRLLMWVDPAGVRWLARTWLDVDRGADFYNTARVGLDAPFLISRFLFVALGLGAIGLAQRHFGATLRGSGKVRRRVRRQRRALAETPPATLADLTLRVAPPRFLRQAVSFARAEAAILLREPGLYLFAFFVLLQSLGNSLVALGAFQTRVLLTPGQLAVAQLNTVSLLGCLLLMFFFVESLERERAAGAAPLVYSSPARTGALLLGKVLGNAVVVAGVLCLTFVGGAIAILVQGRAAPSVVPYLLIWGLLLVPTLVVWAAFLAATYAVAGSRYLTYGIALGAIGLTLYRQLTDGMSWVGNWILWDAARWSDLSTLEIDRSAMVLNRLMVLGLAVFFSAVAVGALRRRAVDPTRLIGRLRPRRLAREAVRYLPYAALPLVAGVALWLAVLDGRGGEAAKHAGKNYWRQNLATWRKAEQPSIAAVEVTLDLEPAERRFHTRGSYRLVNAKEDRLRRFALTGGRHWRDVTWTLDGEPYEPDDRSRLYVFDRALEPGESAEVGFELSGRFPDGISKNGGATPEFILPSGVVLTSFRPSIVPVVGYDESIGVDDDNRYDSADPLPDRYRELLPPAFGSQAPYPVRLTVSVPEAFRANGVGVLESDTVADGRRTEVWVSDEPVRFWNVVAAPWEVRRGAGTAVFYHPGHGYNVEEMSRVLDAARRYYSEWFYPYPWRELKLSEFPGLADYAQGFPTNITFSESIGFLTRPDPQTNAVLLVTAHESAHQWWGNMLTPGDGPGGNVLSEGMAHFSTALLMEAVAGPHDRMEFLKRIEERYGVRRRKDEERPLTRLDGERPGDETVTYDKGGWVMWMLLEQMGRDNLLAGLRSFIAERKDGPDYPLLEDLVAAVRPFAPDAAAFDRFVDQWFFEVVVPEYRLSDAHHEGRGERWVTTARLDNVGSGRMAIDVAASRGDRFDKDGRPNPEYLRQLVTVELGEGESREVKIESDFEPERLVVDPDVRVLQLRRASAVAEL